MLGCTGGRPYLTWHHFDPPWTSEHHHRPEGMIALCREHADFADGGAYTDEQLQRWKATGRELAREIRGRFDWMRHELLVAAAGNFYFEQPLILQVGSRPCIWLTRDDEEYLMLNFCMPSRVSEPRGYIVNNGWVIPPSISDMECPPQGRNLKVYYSNGDLFQVKFFKIDAPSELDKRYPDADSGKWSATFNYPITGVELWERAYGTDLELGPRETKIGGMIIKNGFMALNRGAAIRIGASETLHMPEQDEEETEL